MQSPTEAVDMDVNGDPLLGAYRDLPLSPLPPEEDLLMLCVCVCVHNKSATTEQRPLLPLLEAEQVG